jgi:hypothetical protein
MLLQGYKEMDAEQPIEKKLEKGQKELGKLQFKVLIL